MLRLINRSKGTRAIGITTSLPELIWTSSPVDITLDALPHANQHIVNNLCQDRSLFY